MEESGKHPPWNSGKSLSISKDGYNVVLLENVSYVGTVTNVSAILNGVPCLDRGQPCSTALFRRIFRAALTTALWPGLRPLLLGDRRCEAERLAVTLDITASSTRGTMTAFQSLANHLNICRP